MPRLTIERGRDKGKYILIGANDTATFGRDTRNTVQLNDPLCSRQHFAVVGRDGNYFVKDLGSTNGTFLNGARITEAELRLGDQIEAGETLISFLHEEEQKRKGGLVGSVIGGYRIVERIGRGGMGTVYKAIQLSLERVVALKILAPHLVRNRSFIERFIKEARAAGRLNHPNIVQALDVGSEGRIYYFSMEFMAGGSLMDRLRESPRLPLEESLRIALDVARGLEYAESQGVIHRDIKPDNIMFDEANRAKIGDLGIAEVIEEGRRTFVQSEGVFGSAHYMAPEQAAGKEIDHRVDIYSLGATLYRVLAGRPLFKGSSLREIMDKQINEPPTPLNQIVPDFPEYVVKTVHRMLAKNPSYRHQNARAVVEDISSLLEDPSRPPPSLRPRPLTSITRSRRKKRPKPILWAIGIVVAIGALALFFALSAKQGEPTKLQRQAVSFEGLGKYTEAIALYRRIINEFPDSPQAGEANKQIQKLRETLEKIRRNKRETEALLLYQKAQTLEEESSDIGAVITAYKRVVDEYPDTERGKLAQKKLTELQARRARNQRAQQELIKIRKIHSRFVQGGKLKELAERYEDLLSAYSDSPIVPDIRKALESIRKKSVDLYLGSEEKAFRLAQQRRYADAMAVIKHDIESLYLPENYIERANARVQEYKALEEEARKRPKPKKKPEARRVPEARPSLSPSQLQLEKALSEIEKKKFASALAILRQLHKIPPSEQAKLKFPDKSSLETLIRNCEEKLQQEEALRKERAKKRAGILSLIQNKRSAISKAVKQLIQQHISSRKYYNAGRLSLSAGFFKTSVECFNRFLRAIPDEEKDKISARFFLEYAEALLRLARKEEASRLIDSARKYLFPDALPGLRHEFGELQRSLPNRVKRYEASLKTLDSQAEDPEVLYRSALACAYLGRDYIRATAIMKVLLDNYPDSEFARKGIALWNYANFLGQLDLHREKIQMLRRFLKNYPRHRVVLSGSALWQLAEAYFSAGDKRSALKLYLSFKGKYPEHPACKPPPWGGRARVDKRIEECK